MTRRRLDLELVRRGLATSRQQAERLVGSGRVLVDGSVAAKGAALVASGQAVTVSGPPAPYVSRGGEKLAHALDQLGVAVAGRRCLDVGASTGGFTDCLLQRGAATVVAVDSGHGQLHPTLRADDRVTLYERTNARHLPDLRPELCRWAQLVVADVSFISLTVLVPALVTCCADGADLVLLVKPQFEAGRAEVSRGRGVVRDPAVRRRAVEDVAAVLAAHGVTVVGAAASPVLGPAGNAEFFLHGHLARHREATTEPVGTAGVPDRSVWAGLVARAVSEAPGSDTADSVPGEAVPGRAVPGGGRPGADDAAVGR